MDFWVIFLTGLTTGGLSCLAVQGGLLATAITRPVTIDDKVGKSKRKQSRQQSQVTGVQMAKDPWPVVYFLVAKLLAYTILGALLGSLGSVLRITPTVQAVMLFIAGLFMIVTALNMLNVHPIFRYFTIQPPKAITRLVRNQSKSDQAFTPVLLGLMTVLIPCGTTQAMEVLAISSASPLSGALILFVFVLGTSPTFFVLGFLATQLRGRLQAGFAVGAALLVLAMGVLAIDNGLVLMDSPFAPRTILASLVPTVVGGTQAVQKDGYQELTINVVSNGYVPNVLAAKSGVPIRLYLDTNRTYSCARAFVIRGLGISQLLPETGHVAIEIPAQQAGQIRFSCGMGMYTGVIVVN